MKDGDPGRSRTCDIELGSFRLHSASGPACTRKFMPVDVMIHPNRSGPTRRMVFIREEDRNGEAELQAGSDCLEAALGRCAYRRRREDR